MKRKQQILVCSIVIVVLFKCGNTKVNNNCDFSQGKSVYAENLCASCHFSDTTKDVFHDFRQSINGDVQFTPIDLISVLRNDDHKPKGVKVDSLSIEELECLLNFLLTPHELKVVN